MIQPVGMAFHVPYHCNSVPTFFGVEWWYGIVTVIEPRTFKVTL